MSWLVLFIAFSTFINIMISAYMSYLTINLAVDRCKCAVYNAYWFIIFFYFIFSGMFLIYTMLVIFEYARGYKFVYMIIGYLISTLVFVIGSFLYTRYLTSRECECVTKEYKKVLKNITFVRLLMAIITFIALASWGLYIILQKSFVNKR